MTYCPTTAVKFDALAVVLAAKTGELDAEAVDDLLSKADNLFTSDHPFYRAISAFTTHYPLVLLNPEQLLAQAEILHDALLAENTSQALQDNFGGWDGGFE